MFKSFIKSFQKVKIHPLFLLSVVILSFLSVLSPVYADNSYQTAVSGNSPVSYWRLGESSGTTATDAANSHNGTYNNVTFSQDSLISTDTDNKAVDLNGTDAYVQTPDVGGVYDFTNHFSLEAWIKPTAFPSNGDWAVIIAKNGAYSLRLNGNRLEFATRVNGADRPCQAPAGAISTGNVYHVVGTYDGSHEYLYINGNQRCSLAVTGDQDVNSGALTVGSWDGGIFFFHGIVDEAAVYNTTLTATQVDNHYTTGGGTIVPITYTLSGIVYEDANENGVQDSGESGNANATITLNTGATATTDSTGVYTFTNIAEGSYTATLTVPSGYTSTTTNPASVAISGDTTQNFGIKLVPPPVDNYQTAVSNDSPVSYWRLGEASGTTALNVVAGHNATYYNVSLGQDSLLSEIPGNTSVGLNGTNAYVQVPDLGGVFDFTNHFSLEAWIKPAALPTSGEWGVIIAKNGGYSLRFNGNRLEFSTRVNGVERSCQSQANAITIGNTYHVVGTYDGTQEKLYINGIGVCTISATGSQDINSGALTVGSWDGSIYFFHGIVDEAVVYDTTLTLSQVVNHYTTGSGLVPASPTPTPTAGPTPTPSPTPALTPLPGQTHWKNGVSNFLFGANDNVDWSEDNFVTDPHHIIQPAMIQAGFQVMREFIFHNSIADGHRTTIGTTPQTQPDPNNPHEFDMPAGRQTSITPTSPYGYELETRMKAMENIGAQCLIVLPNIWTDDNNPTDPYSMNETYIDPATGQPETDLAFAKKVVAYLGNRCNMYEIGNEPDLNFYPASGTYPSHMSVQTYLNRWVEFVTALRAINPNAKFMGPVAAGYTGNDCTYDAEGATCYMRNFLKGAKAANVLPDAVTFHWYPCYLATDGFNGNGNCGPNEAASYGSVISQVREWMQQDLGYKVPLLITEWNADPGANPLMEDSSFMTQFTQQAMQSMINAGLDGAFQFNVQSYGGYCHLDMFDSCNGTDQPKAQFTTIANIISQYKPDALTPTPTPTDTPMPTNSPTPTPVPTYSLSGSIYGDLNQNGVQDSSETGVNGVSVSLSSGQSTTTDSNGAYSFSNLTQGTYTITITSPSGYTTSTTNPVTLAVSGDTTQNFGVVSNSGVSWVQGAYTSPSSGTANPSVTIPSVQANHLLVVSFNVGAGFSETATGGVTSTGPSNLTWTEAVSNTHEQTQINVWYAFAPTAGDYTITGHATSVTSDGITVDEYSGVNHANPVLLTASNGGSGTASSVSSTANVAAGSLLYGSLSWDAGLRTVTSGTGFVSHEVFSDATLNQPINTEDRVAGSNGIPAVTWTLGSTTKWNAVMVVLNPSGNVAPYTLSGTVYKDLNQNGVQDTDETGYEGVVITLTNGQTATTSSNGTYSMVNVAPGTYTETVAIPSGYVATTTNPVTLALSSNTTQNFGITAHSAIYWVQGAYTSPSSGTANPSVTLNSAQQNDLLIVSFNVGAGATETATGGVTSAGPANLNWTEATTVNNDGGSQVNIWYAFVQSNGNYTITGHATESTSDGIAVNEYHNVSQTASVLTTGTAIGSTTTQSVSSTTSVPAGSLIYGSSSWDNGNPTVTAGSGFTARQVVTNANLNEAINIEDKIAGSTATPLSNWTLSSSTPWVGAMAVFASQ
jgi:hypothetical protein